VLHLGTTPQWYTSNYAHTWWMYSCTETHSISYIHIDTQSCQVTETYSGNWIMWPYFRGLNNVYMQQLLDITLSMVILENRLFSHVLLYIPLHNLLLLLRVLKRKKGINLYDLLLTSEYNYVHIYTSTQ
jgi:hypothetical protein